MSRRITLGGSVDEVEVDLFGEEVYTVRPMTRSRMAELDPIQARIDNPDDSDTLATAIGEFLDVLFASKTKQRKPSRVIRELWEADKITVNQLGAIFRQLQEHSAPN